MRSRTTRCIAAMLVCLLLASGCTTFERCAGYCGDRPPCVVDPRGVPTEPCLYCEPVPPTCADSNACCQLQRGRETFFDSIYALICECNLCPNSHCCD